MAICLENGCSSFCVIDGKRKEIQVTDKDVTKRYKISDTITTIDVLGGSIQVQDIF